MKHSDVEDIIKSIFYTNTLCSIKLLITLEYLLSKNCEVAGPRLPIGYWV